MIPVNYAGLANVRAHINYGACLIIGARALGAAPCYEAQRENTSKGSFHALLFCVVQAVQCTASKSHFVRAGPRAKPAIQTSQAEL